MLWLTIRPLRVQSDLYIEFSIQATLLLTIKVSFIEQMIKYEISVIIFHYVEYDGKTLYFQDVEI